MELEAILQALAEGDVTERLQAVAECEALGPDAAPAVRLLVELLKVGESWDEELLRHRAIRALEKIGSTEAVPALVELLRGVDKDVPTVHIALAINACSALASIGDRGAIPALHKCLDLEGDDLLRWLSLSAAEARWRISGDQQTVLSIATEMLKDEDWLRCHAIDMLGNFAAARPALADLVNDENTEVARHAREALAAISSGKPSRPFRPAMRILDGEVT